MGMENTEKIGKLTGVNGAQEGGGGKLTAVVGEWLASVRTRGVRCGTEFALENSEDSSGQVEFETAVLYSNENVSNRWRLEINIKVQHKG